MLSPRSLLEAESDLLFFPVNNVLGADPTQGWLFAQAGDPTLRALRAAIESSVKQDERKYIEKQVPVHWMRVLDEMLQSGKPFMGLQAVVDGVAGGVVVWAWCGGEKVTTYHASNDTLRPNIGKKAEVERHNALLVC